MKASADNKDKVIAGYKYAKAHGIKQYQWLKEGPREKKLTEKIIYRFNSYLEDKDGWKRIDEGYNYDRVSDPKATWKFTVNGKCGSYITVGLKDRVLTTIARVVGERHDGSPYVTDNEMPYPYPSEDEMSEYGIVMGVLEKYKTVIVPCYENIARGISENKENL